MNKRIVRYPVRQNLPSWSESLHPVLRRVYAHREVTLQEELNNTFQHLLPFSTLKGITDATSLLEEHIRANKKIVIIGDFDADGATSTAVAVKGLRMMGANEIDFLVPNRFKYGYGLTPEIVQDAHAIGADLIVTVDNGISSLDGVAQARQLNVKVLITDHHLPGPTLPPAEAIVNPNQEGDTFPAKSTAGVGVIFYVLMALRARLRESDWFKEKNIAEPNIANLLDLVALGTVADVVPLEHNNRILVDQGIRRIRAGQACPGVQALIEVSGRNPARLSAADLGFALGPRLNAAGRIEDMRIGIQCLISENTVTARALASQLDMLNQERKQIEGDMQQQALATLERLHLEESAALPLGLCLYDSSWHQGVIGILASRIKEKFHRPVIAFAQNDEHEIKGSARSIPGVHIRDVLDAIAARHPGLLTKFGGHAMAAGLSLPQENFAKFKQAFETEIQHHISEEKLEGIIHSDGELDAKDLCMEVAGLLQQAGPWGQDFPEPVFDGVFIVNNQRVVGEKHLKLTLRHPDKPSSLDAIAFNAVDQSGITPVNPGDYAHVAYKLDINEFRGQTNLQLMIEHIAPLETDKA